MTQITVSWDGGQAVYELNHSPAAQSLLRRTGHKSQRTLSARSEKNINFLQKSVDFSGSN